MDSAFAWIGQIVEWFGKFIPRLAIVRSTHAGVRFRHGSIAKRLGPGLHFYWPIVTEVDIMPVARQTHNLASQSLLTKDGKQVVVGGVVVYEIKDIVAALSKNWDISDTINDITMVAITEIITTHELDYLLGHVTDEVQAKLSQVTRKKLKPFGIRVYRAALTDFSTCMVVKNITGNSSSLVVPFSE